MGSRNQRPELWNLFNTRIEQGEHVRVFPLSNWTELDIWDYVRREEIALPSIYFAHTRRVFERDGLLLDAETGFANRGDDEPEFEATVRYRTVGDASCTGAVKSSAASLEQVIEEIAATRITERGQTRADDRTSEAAMEDRKKEGYFGWPGTSPRRRADGQAHGPAAVRHRRQRGRRQVDPDR